MFSLKVETDALRIGIGGVLMQKGKVIEYFSKKLNEVQRK